MNTQYATAIGVGEMNTMFMGTVSQSRRRSQEARAREARARKARRFSNTRRYDSQGRGFFRIYYKSWDRSWLQGCDRRSHLREQGGFQRERSGSRSRLGNFERGQSWSRENRGSQSSNDRKGEYDRCFAYICKNCIELLTKIHSIAVILAMKDTEVNLCEIYATEKVPEGEKVMILDVGAPVSLVGRSLVQKYLREFGYEIEDMVSLKCYQVN